MAAENTRMVDRLSELPEPILHHIMSFLSMADTIRTGTLSKTFSSVVSCYPMMAFNFGHGRPSIHARVTNGYGYFSPQIDAYLDDVVDSTIQKKNKENNSVKGVLLDKFRLQVPMISIIPDGRIHRAISFATRKGGVKELDIDFGFGDEFYTCSDRQADYYPLPLHAIIYMRCPNNNPITTLHLRGLDIGLLPELAIGCPNIGTLSIRYCTVSLPQNHLVKMNLPNLQHFTHKGRANRGICNYRSLEVVFDLSSCTSLKVVSLENGLGIDDLWMEKHIFKLTCLETLELIECRELENLKVSGHDKLTTVKLKGCDRLKSFQIGASQHILHL